jgi:tetratricopeptide (TPR) repeat protein
MRKQQLQACLIWIAVIVFTQASDVLADTQASEDELTSVQQLWVNSFDAEKGGDYDKALEYTTRIMRDAGDYYLPNLRMGWLHYLKEDYKTAINYYRKAAQLSPGSVSALQGGMNCAKSMGDSGREMQLAKAILLLDPMNYQANLRLAALNYANANYSAAGSYYRKLLSLYPEDLQIANGVAWCYLKEGLSQEAAVIFRNILIVHPNYYEAKTGLAACVSKKGIRVASMSKWKER